MGRRSLDEQLRIYYRGRQREYVKRYREKYRRFDYVPSKEALEIIERCVSKSGISIKNAIDNLVVSGNIG